MFWVKHDLSIRFIFKMNDSIFGHFLTFPESSVCQGITLEKGTLWTLRASGVPTASKGNTSMLRSCFAPTGYYNKFNLIFNSFGYLYILLTYYVKWKCHLPSFIHFQPDPVLLLRLAKRPWDIKPNTKMS